jgi:hypothetical protein
VKRFVAQDAGVVDHDRETAEFVQRLLNDALASFNSGDVIVVGNGHASAGSDLSDHARGWGGVPAEVVDDNARAATSELQRMAAAEPATGAGHYRNVAIEFKWRACDCHVRPS